MLASFLHNLGKTSITKLKLRLMGSSTNLPTYQGLLITVEWFIGISLMAIISNQTLQFDRRFQSHFKAIWLMNYFGFSVSIVQLW